MEQYKRWLFKTFMTREECLDNNHKVLNRLRQLETKISQHLQKPSSDSKIDLELFGIRLLRARLMNVSRNLFLMLVMFSVALYFLFWWFK